jgi:hypothetical protein
MSSIQESSDASCSKYSSSPDGERTSLTVEIGILVVAESLVSRLGANEAGDDDDESEYSLRPSPASAPALAVPFML